VRMESRHCDLSCGSGIAAHLATLHLGLPLTEGLGLDWNLVTDEQKELQLYLSLSLSLCL
jgi:hypothetical protein